MIIQCRGEYILSGSNMICYNKDVMIKAKALPINIILPAMIVLAASLILISRPHITSKTTAPVFTDEVTIVNKVVPAAKANIVSTSKTVVQPVIKPSIPAPLPPVLPPKVIYKVMPVYPLSALEKGLEGTIILSVYIGGSGRLEKIENKVSSGSGELDASAVNAVSQWRFDPASRGSQVIDCWFEIPVTFKLK